MPATSLDAFIYSLLTPDQKAAICAFAMTGGSAMPASTAMPARTTTRTKRSGTSAGSGSANTETLARYFADHPTAIFSQAQLREVSPFKTWRPNILGRTLAALTKQRKLIRAGDAWRLSNVVPTRTLDTRRSRRATKTTAAAARRTGTEG